VGGHNARADRQPRPLIPETTAEPRISANLSTMRLAFEYDPRKAAANLRKHGVSFAEAMTAFDDPLAETFPDELRSGDETRFITLGLSSRQRPLFISHLEEDNRIRLIGARLADNAEREAYEELQRRS
jgi:uncharacterized DUF497 family protein